MPKQVKRGLAGVAATDVVDAIDSKFLVMDVAHVAEAIREKEEKIARLQLQREFVVAGR